MSAFLSISVIVPAYNVEDWLAQTLNSILEQRYQPREIILVDDGSTDSTAAVAYAWREYIRYVYRSNGGPAAARNTGIELAQGDAIAFLDADDLWLPDTLAVLADTMHNRDDLDIVQGHLQDWWPTASDRQKAFGPPRVSYNLGSALFRWPVFGATGHFDTNLRRGEDIDFWLRMRECGLSHQVIDNVTLYYRRRPPSPRDTKAIYHHNLLRLVKRSLDRTRGPV